MTFGHLLLLHNRMRLFSRVSGRCVQKYNLTIFLQFTNNEDLRLLFPSFLLFSAKRPYWQFTYNDDDNDNDDDDNNDDEDADNDGDRETLDFPIFPLFLLSFTDGRTQRIIEMLRRI